MTRPSTPEPVDLAALAGDMLAAARAASAGRAARAVHSGAGLLRQNLLALVAGAELAAHDSPPEATLQVLSGRIRLQGQDRAWELGAGHLLPIPPERHSVAAIDDSVFLLTVRRDAAPPTGDLDREAPTG
ncbi:LuxR family transcriptional regulator [Microbacterium sp.]|uniref:LuxR family transcriptional regulator n=1 Tax=Microbacterium sp. TaxID=51671 RepID=UPI003A8C262D